MVTKVLVERDGQSEEYSADIVVVSCGAINSAALLLRSANDKHPNGLANSSDVVGRHYMRHNNSAFMAISKQPNPTVFQKTLGLNDFYFRSDDWEYPLGGIQMLGKTDGEMLKGEAPGWAVWKPEFALDYMAEHSIDFWVQSEDLPNPDNRVSVNAKGEIRLDIQETNVEGSPSFDRKAQGYAQGPRSSRPLDVPIVVSRQEYSDWRYRSSGWNGSVRPRSQDFGARSELQGSRFGESLCRRCEFLRVHCSRESQLDHHCERTASGRPLAETAGITENNKICSLR